MRKISRISFGSHLSGCLKIEQRLSTIIQSYPITELKIGSWGSHMINSVQFPTNSNTVSFTNDPHCFPTEVRFCGVTLATRMSDAPAHLVRACRWYCEHVLSFWTCCSSAGMFGVCATENDPQSWHSLIGTHVYIAFLAAVIQAMAFFFFSALQRTASRTAAVVIWHVPETSCDIFFWTAYRPKGCIHQVLLNPARRVLRGYNINVPLYQIFL